jgi:hypothetical protein
MLAVLALASVIVSPATVEIFPTDDIWVYPHASDPEKDVYLRVWGADGKDVASDMAELENLSYSYLKFDLSKLPEGKITGATLTLTHIGGAGYDLAYAKQNPLRVRPLPANFTEKKWDHGQAEKVAPEAGAMAIFGSGFPEAIPSDGKEFTISIDLLKGANDFKTYVQKARASETKSMALALTALMDVAEKGQKCIYKVYSKDEEKATRRPVLKLTLE